MGKKTTPIDILLNLLTQVILNFSCFELSKMFYPFFLKLCYLRQVLMYSSVFKIKSGHLILLVNRDFIIKYIKRIL